MTGFLCLDGADFVNTIHLVKKLINCWEQRECPSVVSKEKTALFPGPFIPTNSHCHVKKHSFSFSHLPQHLDGVDNSNVGVVEVVEGAKGEGREGPDQGLGQVGDDGRASEERGPDVVDHDGLNAPVAVKD